MSKTFVVDGNSLFFRAYHSTVHSGNLMITKDNIPTNAIFAFHNFMKTIKAMAQEGDRIFVAFDTDKPTFRKMAFQEYKAQRKPLDEAIIAQIPISRELLDCMSIYHQEREGYEADDLCGSMARYAHEKGDDVILISSDRDLFQLLDIGDNVRIICPLTGLSKTAEYTRKTLKDSEFGLNPDQVTDFKGIAGDPSDNYKGIPGIGEKTAKKLLEECGHLEEVLKKAEGLAATSKTYAKIVAGAEQALFFKKLATIDTSLDMKEDYEKSLYRPYLKERLSAFYLHYEFKSFLSKIDKLKGIVSATEGEQMTLEDAFQESQEVQSLVKEKSHLQTRPIVEIQSMKGIPEPVLGITYDSDGSNENTANLLGFALIGKDAIYHLRLEQAREDKDFFSYLLSSEKKTVYDLKGLYVYLGRYDFPFLEGCDFDLLLATYLINTDCGQKVEELFFSYGLEFSHSLPVYSQSLGLAVDLKEQVIADIKKNGEEELFYEIELPLARVLAKMELEGVPMDLKTLEEIGIEYGKRLDQIREEIYRLSGKEFNVNSPKKVEEVLFTDLKIPRNRGEHGSGIEVLNAHVGDSPVVPLIIQYRLYSKLISGYTSALPKHLGKDGKIHAIYNQALTATGRLSMSEPNLQNISIRNEEGKAIRKAFFYPEKAFYLLSLDYSQIELRVLAHVGGIQSLVDIFKEGEDIHKATASRVFKVPIEEVTPEMRRRAKAVNFGIVYGISAYGLSEQLGIPTGEAKELIRSFKAVFPEIDTFETQTIESARKHGFVETIFHRRRYLKDINVGNHSLRQFSERAAVNTVIQGSAADLMKISMIKADEALRNFQTKIILQIHDELIFKVPKDELEAVVPLLKKTMEEAVKLNVPLKVDGDYSLTWYEAH